MIWWGVLLSSSLFHRHFSCRTGTERPKVMPPPLSAYPPKTNEVVKNNLLASFAQEQCLNSKWLMWAGERRARSVYSVVLLDEWKEHDQPWPLYVTAIAKATQTPSKDFMLTGVDVLN